MPILSYLVLPNAGAKGQLFTDLSAMECCEVLPSDNEEVLVLVTDNPDETSEKTLQKNLKI